MYANFMEPDVLPNANGLICQKTKPPYYSEPLVPIALPRSPQRDRPRHYPSEIAGSTFEVMVI